MGRVQGGARAAFATLSWGPSRIIFIPDFKSFFYLFFRKKHKEVYHDV